MAPTSEALRAEGTGGGEAPKVGPLSELPGPENAEYQVAPDLSFVVRGLMERKQISPENIDLYLKRHPPTNAQNHAFKVFWAFCVMQGREPLHLAMEEVAIMLEKLHEHNPGMSKGA